MSETEQKPEPEKPVDAKPVEKAATPADQSLIDRIMGVMKDVMDRKLGDFEKAIDGKIDTILKAKEIEVEQTLRKGFGLENDPVIHMSDLIAYGRKHALEKADTDKRTPGPETPAGPEGNTPLSEVDALFEKAKKGEMP